MSNSNPPTLHYYKPDNSEIVKMFQVIIKQLAGLEAEVRELRGKHVESNFYTLKEAAKILCVSPSTVKRFIEKSGLKRSLHTSKILIKHEDLMTFKNKM